MNYRRDNVLVDPGIGELWTRRDVDPDLKFRVMAVVENYVMSRSHGCMPFLVHLNRWHKEYIAPGPVCGNCDTRLPVGCAGEFLDDDSCMLNRKSTT